MNSQRINIKSVAQRVILKHLSQFNETCLTDSPVCIFGTFLYEIFNMLSNHKTPNSLETYDIDTFVLSKQDLLYPNKMLHTKTHYIIEHILQDLCMPICKDLANKMIDEKRQFPNMVFTEREIEEQAYFMSKDFERVKCVKNFIITIKKNSFFEPAIFEKYKTKSMNNFITISIHYLMKQEESYELFNLFDCTIFEQMEQYDNSYIQLEDRAFQNLYILSPTKILANEKVGPYYEIPSRGTLYSLHNRERMLTNQPSYNVDVETLLTKIYKDEQKIYNFIQLYLENHKFQEFLHRNLPLHEINYIKQDVYQYLNIRDLSSYDEFDDSVSFEDHIKQRRSIY